jgi:serine/threonine protein kinase
MLNTLHNDSIIEVYTTYRHNGLCNYLFPLADMDLEGLLSGKKSSTSFGDSMDVLKAIHGLSTAISALHEFNDATLEAEFKGCHHDLKPQNILVKKCRFLLADFGLSRLKPEDEDSITISRALGDYLSPECRSADKTRQRIGRKSDIWSFGCIVAECMAYMKGGSDKVREFREIRKSTTGPWTTYSFHENGNLKNEIRDWLSLLPVESFEHNYALLCELIKSMLDGVSSRRPSAKTVENSLLTLSIKWIFEQCLENYRQLIATSEDPYMVIQSERLRSWGFATGLHQPEGPWTWRTCEVELLGRATRDCLEKISQHLQHMAEEKSVVQKVIADRDLDNSKTNGWDLSQEDSITLSGETDKLNSTLPPPKRRLRDSFLFSRISQTTDNTLRQIGSEPTIGTAAGREIQMMAQLKLMDLAFLTDSDSGAIDHQLPHGAVVPNGAVGQHTIASYTRQETTEPETVLVEWRPINSPNQEVSKKLLRRVDSLAGLYNNAARLDKLRVLECLGFYLDRNRREIGVVYRFPRPVFRSLSPVAPPLQPRSLYDLINSCEDPISGQILLRERFEIVRQITTCILYCHSLQWLHERLNSKNIVFFLPENTTLAKSRALPYLIGWNHSRRDEKNEISHGPPQDTLSIDYLHPEYVALKSFKQVYDYYSLGLIMLEVGLWRTIPSIRAEKPYHDLLAFRAEIIREFLPQLRYKMGDLYFEAVDACLSGGLEAKELWNADRGDLLAAFQRLVVGKLESCAV